MKKISNEVLHNMVENLTKQFDMFMVETKEFREEDRKVKAEILQRVTIQNGKTSTIENILEDEVLPDIKDYRENRAQARGAWKLWLLVVGGIVSVLSWAFVLYMNNLKLEIIEETAKQVSPVVSDAVYTKLEKEYNIQIK